MFGRRLAVGVDEDHDAVGGLRDAVPDGRDAPPALRLPEHMRARPRGRMGGAVGAGVVHHDHFVYVGPDPRQGGGSCER